MTFPAFRTQVSSYFDSKNYNTDFGDLLLLFAANAFKLQVIITQSPYFKLKDCLIVLPSGTFTLKNVPFIALHLLYQHYSGTAFTISLSTSALAGAPSSTSSRPASAGAPSSTIPPPASVGAPSSSSLRPASAGAPSSTILPSILDGAPSSTPSRLMSASAPSSTIPPSASAGAPSSPSSRPASAGAPSFTSKRTRPSSVFRVAHFNIQLGKGSPGQDAYRKIDELRSFFSTNNAPHVLCLNEIWLSAKIDSSELNIANYSLFRKDRKGRCGGGVALYVNQELNHTLCNIDDARFGNLEVCTIKIQPLRARALIICCIYRPPSVNTMWLDIFHTFLLELTNSSAEVTLLGDFNINLILNNGFSSDLATDFGLTQIISEPTRIAKSSATLIEHIYVPKHLLIRRTVVTNLHLSDHCLVSCEIFKCTTGTHQSSSHRLAQLRYTKKY